MSNTDGSSYHYNPHEEICDIDEENTNEIAEIIQRKTSKSNRDLQQFIDENVDFMTKKGDQRTNIVNLGKKRTYYINDMKLPKFFMLLERCRRDNNMLHWQERQNGNSSGIMLDFDRYQKSEIRSINERHFIKLTNAFIKVLTECIDFSAYATEEFRTKVFIIQKPKLVRAERNKFDKSKGVVYKDGFHMLIPEIQVNRGFKKYIQNKLVADGVFRKVFNDIDCDFQSADDMFDSMSNSVNTCFVGNSKSGKPAYNLVYVIDVSLDVASGDCNTIPLNLNTLTNYNLVYELSLSFQFDSIDDVDGNPMSTWLNKRHYNYRKELEPVIQSIIEKRRDDVGDDMQETNDDLSILTVNDPQVSLIRKLLILIDPIFAKDYEHWRNIIFAIADTSAHYKPLAKWFSHDRRPESYDAAAFESLWDEAINRKGVDNPVTKRSIYHWAKVCSPEKYKEVLNQSYHQMLYMYCIKHDGVVEQGMVAKILYNMLGDRFAVDIVSLSARTNKYIWYEFVTPGQHMKQGQVYKWREEAEPDAIHMYMQERLPAVYQQITDKIKDQKDESESDQHVKYWAKVEKIFRTYITKLYNNSFQNGVVKQARFIFRRRGFIDELNTYPDIIGVCNGVLKISYPIKMIKGFHEYKISKSTVADYIPYDRRNPHIQKLEAAFESTYPEPDAAWFWKMYYGTFVSPAEADSICGMQVGGGSNGKTFWSELSAEALGDDNSVKISIALLTDAREKAREANSAFMATKGKTQIRFSEPNGLEELNTGRLKEMFGEEKQSGRGNYGDHSNFRMTASPIITSNYDFVVSSSTYGLWRRMRYYRMKITFKSDPEPGNKFEQLADDAMKNYKNQPEMLSAMLSMMVHWNQVLQLKYGGRISNVPCPTIKAETDNWQNRQDTLNKYITQMVMKSAPGEESKYQYALNAIALSYIEWYNNNVRSSKKHNIEQVMSNIENSSISKSLKRRPDGTVVLIAHRIKDTVADVMRPGEQLISFNTDANVTDFSKASKLDRNDLADVFKRIDESYYKCGARKYDQREMEEIDVAREAQLDKIFANSSTQSVADLLTDTQADDKSDTTDDVDSMSISTDTSSPLDDNIDVSMFEKSMQQLNESEVVTPQGVSESYGKIDPKKIKFKETKNMPDDMFSTRKPPEVIHKVIETPKVSSDQLAAISKLFASSNI